MNLEEFSQTLECQQNIKMSKGNYMTLDYADYELTGQGIRHRRSPRYLYFKLRGECMISRKFHWVVSLFRFFERVIIFLRREWLGIVLIPLLPIFIIVTVYCVMFSREVRDVLAPKS